MPVQSLPLGISADQMTFLAAIPQVLKHVAQVSVSANSESEILMLTTPANHQWLPQDEIVTI